MGKGEETRGAILERALGLASQVGLEGLTIGRLADELSLSKSGLFAHFRSKQALQVSTLESAAERFTEAVVRPALAAPRGEKRVRALFDGWMRWPTLGPQRGCIFVAAAADLDDRPGPARECLVRLQRQWLDLLATAIRQGQEICAFRADMDPAQFAFDLYGVMLAYHHASRLMRDSKAAARARLAFERLLVAARAT